MGDLHRRILDTLGKVLCIDSVEWEIAEHGIILKGNMSKSWFVYIGKILVQYKLFDLWIC